MASLLVLTNSLAGSHDPAVVDAVAQRLRSAGHDIALRDTSGPDDLRAAIADREGRDLVVAGGDGSLHAVVAALDDLGLLGDAEAPAIGVIPLGTGNDFARGAGIPLEPGQAARLLTEGPARWVDVLVDDRGHLVVNAVHIGVGAEAGRRAEPWKHAFGRVGLGPAGYAVGALLAASTTRGWMARVTVDDVEMHRGPVLQIGIANGSTIGGGTPLAPAAEPRDGRADVVVSRAVGPVARLRYGIGLARGTHHRHGDVEAVLGRTVTVEAAPGSTFRANADGEISAEVSRRTWTLRPHAVRVHLPC